MIPLATTTITATRPSAETQAGDPYGDGYDDPPEETPGGDEGEPTTVGAGIRAVISPGSARGTTGGGESEVAQFRLVCDPIPLSYLDTVVDDSDGTEYEVAWAHTTPGLAGLGHTSAGLNTTKGETS